MNYIFGPVASRRLGLSLGVDLVPYKTCSFDCIYCELGKTTNKTILRKEYVPFKIIIEELKKYLDKIDIPPDYITLGGSGEPTLNLAIGNILKEIKKLTKIPVAVITNSSLLFLKQLRKELKEADLILPSLDGVDKDIIFNINRPHTSLTINKIIEGLINFRKEFEGQIWLEILFCQGINDKEEELLHFKNLIEKLNPEKVQINTVARPPSLDFAIPLNRIQLESIQKIIGEKAEIIADFSSKICQEKDNNYKENKILNLLRRRPCHIEEISFVLGIKPNKLKKYLDKLRGEDKVKYKVYNSKVFYTAT
jgi:wyosine [tRNA(Phe)-imidazoG37] synthetase (radical SAM superfamily)